MALLIIFLARYLVAVPFLILIYLWTQAQPPVRMVIFKRTLLSFLIGYLLFDIAQYLVPEIRPYLAQGISALINNPPINNSFPSGHTFDAFTVAFLVLPFDLPLGIISVVIALVVAIGRIAAHVHYPIDILGGIVISLVVTQIAAVIFKKKSTQPLI